MPGNDREIRDLAAMIATRPRNRMETVQDVETPDAFFQLVDREFDFVRDLAATKQNRKCTLYVTPEEDSLTVPWAALAGWQWLNPPFRDIEPWVKKCCLEAAHGAQVVLLVPASTGANWFMNWVWGKAEIRFLNGRLTFKGHDKPYPKDLLLAVYERGRFPKVDCWNWRKAK